MNTDKRSFAIKGLVVFSFGLCAEELEPNPCNMRLGDEVQRIINNAGEPARIVVQWEVARCLERLDITPDAVVGLWHDGNYLDTKAVWNEAREFFKGHDNSWCFACHSPHAAVALLWRRPFVMVS